MELNFKTFGEGQPLIILHGLFGTLDNWQTLGKYLAEHFMVYLVDLRNHGRSPHVDGMTYLEMAEDLKGFMESHWIYEANLMGHSMGGKVAMQFSLEYPHMVNKLIVVDIAPKQYAPGHDTIFKALYAVGLDQLQDRKQAEEILKQHISEEGTWLFLMKNLSRTKDGRFEWKMNLDVLYRDYNNILSALDNGVFNKETLFVRGEKSNYILDEDVDQIKKKFPESTILTIPGAGHWIHADKPQELLQEIKNFLM